MIQKLTLLHYLSESAYKKVCEKLNLGDHNSRPANKVKSYYDEKIIEMHLFNIVYEQFGHIWFMGIDIDFPKFKCDYNLFEQNLYAHYHTVFGREIMSDFPSYDQLCCSYIEYSSIIQTKNASNIIENLRDKCAPEQLDKTLWSRYKKPNGTIAFCISACDHGIETLARCHGTALKKRITDRTLHQTVGLVPSCAISHFSEDTILNWLYKKYGIC